MSWSGKTKRLIVENVVVSALMYLEQYDNAQHSTYICITPFRLLPPGSLHNMAGNRVMPQLDTMKINVNVALALDSKL